MVILNSVCKKTSEEFGSKTLSYFFQLCISVIIDQTLLC